MDKGKNTQRTGNVYIDISEPLSFWIIILAIALIIGILINDTPAIQSGSSQYSFLNPLYNFILIGPGTLILPLIAGAAVGIEVGHRARNAAHALKLGLVNAIYAAVIYVIAIVILYEVAAYALPKTGINTNTLIYSWIIVPVIIFVLVVEALAYISNSRKVQ